MSTIQDARAAWPLHSETATALAAELRRWCDRPLPQVPGMDTATRLALRLYYGRTPAEALAREYAYRWQLAVKPFGQIDGAGTVDPAVSIFGAPHTIGM